MITSQDSEFFVAATGAAGALIGLLFVAVSVAAERFGTHLTADKEVRAAAALLLFTNVLIVSLVALIPGAGVGTVASVLGGTGVVFALASARGTWRGTPREKLRAVGLSAGLAVAFALQLFYGLQASVSGVQALMIACLSVGISRAWDVVGLQSTGIVASLLLLGRGRTSEEAENQAVATGASAD